jgi:hypothetical protein
MSDFELTPSGLETQTQDEIANGITGRLRSTFGVNFNTAADSITGQLVNITAELLALNQQQALAVYRSFDPNSAQGTALDARANLTGSVRRGATSSTVVGVLTFSGAGTANNGDLIRNVDNDTEWALVDGPHTAVGPFPEDIPATFSSVDTGAALANAGTNWNIITPVVGLDTFTNPTDDANPGRDQETDPEFRVRRQVELFSQNVGGLAAISAVVSRADDRIISVRTYHNPATNPFDADGIPFKAFNVVVETNPTVPPPDLVDITFRAIMRAIGAGGEAYGTDFTGTTTDSEGQLQPVAFDVVSLTDVFINITLTTTGTEEEISPNLEQVVAANVLERCQNELSGLGQDTLAFKIVGFIGDLASSGEISGVVQTVVELSLVAVGGPYVDPVPIGIRERADFDSVNIVVAQV